MNLALIPVNTNRPAVLMVDGAIVYISVHDAYHRQMRATFKHRLSQAHPASAFQRLYTTYTHWLSQETGWYRQIGMEPPTW